MKKISHLGFGVTLFAVMTLGLVVMSVSGFVIERDIVRLSANPPVVNTDQNRARVAGVSIESVDQATIIIDRGDGEPLQIDFPVLPDMTAQDILQQVALAFDLSIETVQSPFGTVVRTIGDRTNGDDFNFWVFTVNGSQPLQTADRTVIKGGDEIRFTFERQYQPE
ncbi:MAG: DUF4430 domain-containing protein [Patescibacteria group bacterium]